MNQTLSKILRRTAKIGLWTGGVLLLLFIVLLVIGSQIPKHKPFFFDGDFVYWPHTKDKATGEGIASLLRVEGKTSGMEEFAIPSTANNKGKTYRITRFFPTAFSSCSNLTSITIPECITLVGNGAFSYCTNLTNIRVAQGNNNYTSVDGVLFTIDMSSITAYPAGKKEETYTIPNTVTDIGGGAFYSCFTLTNITIPEGVTSIDGEAFYGCSGLKYIAIPNTVTNIEGSAFAGCESLTKIVIPQGVTTLNNGIFHSCSSLTNVTIPRSVTSIGHKAFARCTSLTSVTIPEGVNRIEERAFQECKNLKNVYFKGSPAENFIRAFYGNTILHYIEGTPGWTTPEWNGFTTRIWVPEP